MSFFPQKCAVFCFVAGWFLNPTFSLPTSDAASTASIAGSATFYGGNTVGGMCSFTGYTIPSGTYGTAVSSSNWNFSEICGACVSVTGPLGTIRALVRSHSPWTQFSMFCNNVWRESYYTSQYSSFLTSLRAQITDQCPNCGPNHLDLYQDAFAVIASPSAGNITVTWAVVPCAITRPLLVRNKSGTSKYWFSMQVVNSNTAVTALDVSIDGGSTWKNTVRRDYNYFEKNGNDGFGTDTVDVRITSSNGKQIIVSGMSVASEKSKNASGNF